MSARPVMSVIVQYVRDASGRRGGVEILLVASCYGNRDKLRSDGPLSSYRDLTLRKGCMQV